MRNRNKLVHGVGANDAEYNVYRYSIIDNQHKIVWTCPFYRSWVSMLQRCYDRRLHIRQSTYAGCEVYSEWHRFSNFSCWMKKKDWSGKDLDKDILYPGNKIYSPDTCVFVSRELNRFLNNNFASRGEWPIGVSWEKGKLKAQCNNPFTGKKEFLGYFSDSESAHQSWRARKHELACIYADQQTDPRIAKALRTRFA